MIHKQTWARRESGGGGGGSSSSRRCDGHRDPCDQQGDTTRVVATAAIGHKETQAGVVRQHNRLRDGIGHRFAESAIRLTGEVVGGKDGPIGSILGNQVEAVVEAQGVAGAQEPVAPSAVGTGDRSHGIQSSWQCHGDTVRPADQLESAIDEAVDVYDQAR